MTMGAICLLLICLLIQSSCSSPITSMPFRTESCSDPSVQESLLGSELKRRTGFTRIQCALNCFRTPNSTVAVDVTIGGQKTCIILSGVDRTSVMPNYTSHSDCRILIAGAYHLSCQPGYTGRFCEYAVPYQSDAVWISGTWNTDLEHKIRTVERMSDGTLLTLIYTHSSIERGPPLQTEGYPFLSYDWQTKSIYIPATREARHTFNQSLEGTKVAMNGTTISTASTTLIELDVYRRNKFDFNNRPTIEYNRTTNRSEYFLKGYRNEDTDYSAMQRDPSSDNVWHYLMYFVRTNYTNPVRPMRFQLKRYNYDGLNVRKQQQWSSSTVYVNTWTTHQRDTYYEDCWYEAAENKVDAINYMGSKVKGEGQPVRVVLDGNLSADALFLISTEKDLIAVMAPYVEMAETDKKFPDPSIMVYTSVSSDGVQTQQKITYEGSTFQQVVNSGGGHEVRWFLSTRNWRRILRVTPGNQILRGNESDLRDAANQGFSISACAVLVNESWCFGTRAVAIVPDGEVLIQSPPIPLIVVQSQGTVFLNVPDLQVVVLKSRGGCQKLVYQNGVTGETLAGCPGVMWLDWFVENY